MRSQSTIAGVGVWETDVCLGSLSALLVYLTEATQCRGCLTQWASTADSVPDYYCRLTTARFRVVRKVTLLGAQAGRARRSRSCTPV